jgi:hypothetical protein
LDNRVNVRKCYLRLAFIRGFERSLCDSDHGGTMNAATPLPENYVLHMPPLKHALNSDVWIPAARSISGRDQSERTCIRCGAVRVTLHGTGFPRAWRRSADAAQIETFEAPVCVPVQNETAP